MEQTGKHGNGHHNLYCCGPMMKHSKQSCGLGFGIMLILLGTIWLASEMGFVAPDLFWPILLLTTGFVLLIINLSMKRRSLEGYKAKREV